MPNPNLPAVIRSPRLTFMGDLSKGGLEHAQLLDWLNKYVFLTKRSYAEKAFASSVAKVILNERLGNGITTSCLRCIALERGSRNEIGPKRDGFSPTVMRGAVEVTLTPSFPSIEECNLANLQRYACLIYGSSRSAPRLGRKVAVIA